MKKPPAIFAAIALLTYFAANLAFAEYHAKQPSQYLIGGYRGAAILVALAIFLFLFPKIGRWIVGVFFALAALIFLPSAIRAFAITRCIVCVVDLLLAVWLFSTKFPVEPPPLDGPRA